jgi:hypothetical protein
MSVAPPIAPSVPSGSAPSYPVRRSGWWITAVVIAAFFSGIAGGSVGVLVGTHTRQTAAPVEHTASTPSPAEARAQTFDLCTRFAGAYAAMPDTQTTGLDVIPTVNYIADALRDNPVADPQIRAALNNEVRLMREKIAAFSREPQHGAVQAPPLPWDATELRINSGRTWDLCENYGS